MILSQNNKIKILANEVLDLQNHDENKDSFEVVTCPWNALSLIHPCKLHVMVKQVYCYKVPLPGDVLLS